MGSLSRDARVLIVGAGAAGLSMAIYLRDLGYRNIVILEREAFPGGKCRTYRGPRGNWELGAVLGTTDYEATIDIMRRYGVEQWRPQEPRRPADTSGEAAGLWSMERLFPGWVSYAEASRALLQMARYGIMAKGMERVFLPGNDGLPSGLAKDFSSWARDNGMEDLAKLFAIPFTGFGYGFFEDVPAAYLLKYMEPPVALSLAIQSKFFKWEHGIQELWERVARDFDVRYGASIREVRRGDEVSVRGPGLDERGEALVLSSPLDEALGFLDASEEERYLFARIRHTDYRVFLSRVRGLSVEAGFAPARLSREGLGKPMIWDRRVRSEELYTYYFLGDGSQSDGSMEEAIAEDARALGGVFEGTEARARWKYFPHVGREDLEAGYYERLEALQGRSRTYYAGELLSFSTVEQTLRYSRALARRCFS